MEGPIARECQKKISSCPGEYSQITSKTRLIPRKIRKKLVIMQNARVFKKQETKTFHRLKNILEVITD